jgi:hypothetical protein
MGEPSLQEKIERLAELAAREDRLSKSLLRAYALRVTAEEIGEAVVLTLDANKRLRAPILNRLHRLTGEQRNAGWQRALAARLLELKAERPAFTRRVNAILTRLYDVLGPDLRHAIVEAWRDDSRLDSARCWLDAATRDPEQFDPSQLFRYWQATGDRRAARLIANQAPAGFLVGILPALIAGCAENEGPIVSRAAIRSHEAQRVGPGVLAAIQERFPVSYAYVCAMTGTPIPHEVAMATVQACASSGPRDERGLVVWCIGRLEMWDTLDRIREIVPELLEADRAAELRSFGLLEPVPLDEDGPE